jgi:hypothetical protein
MQKGSKAGRSAFLCAEKGEKIYFFTGLFAGRNKNF